MANDHYVSQVYLRHFSRDDCNRVFVYQKNQPKVICKLLSTKSICFEVNRDSNQLFNSELQEQWKKGLKHYEDGWNHCVSYISNKHNIDNNLKKFLSDYFSILLCNSPIQDRLSDKMGQELMTNYAINLIKSGTLPKLPDIIKEKINKGEVPFEVQIKKEVINALNLKTIPEIADKLFASPWQILFSESNEFLTSDLPIKHFYTKGEYDINACPILFIPITPKIAILIYTSFLLGKNRKSPKDCNSFGVCFGDLKSNAETKEFIKKLNVCTIKSAERYIISCKKDESINKLVNIYKNYELKSDFYNFDCDEGSIFFSKRRLFETK